MNRLKASVLLYLKGVGMGAADVVPGVSGGTIALITGIYERLLNAIKSFDLKAIKLIRKLKIQELWRQVDGKFLTVLVAGIATSIFSLSKLITYLLAAYPIHVWSFFFGLIIISSVLVLRNIRKWNIVKIISLIAGVVSAYLITAATPATTPEGLWFIFLCGAVAICAMILPGISGSFILLIMGKYEFIFNALHNRDLVVIVTFMVGCAAGLLSFARVISWFLKKYHDLTISLLAGFMIGSLNKVWPWKLPLTYRIHKGEQVVETTYNVLPGDYARHFGENPQLFQGLLFIALGIFIIVAIEKIAILKNSK